MKFREALGEVLREERHAQARTMRSISDEGFIALGYLSEIERGQKDPSSETIDAVAHGLNRQPYELIIEAALKMYRDSSTEIYFDPESPTWKSQYADLVK